MKYDILKNTKNFWMKIIIEIFFEYYNILIMIFKHWIIKHEKEIDFESLSYNPNVPDEIVKEYNLVRTTIPMILESCRFSFDEMRCKHPLMTIELALTLGIFSTNGICKNKSTTFEQVMKYKVIHWNWKILSANANFTWKHVIEHPEIKWDAIGLSRNPSITCHIIFNNLELYEWSFQLVSSKEDLMFWMVDENPHLNWNWSRLSKNPFTLEHKINHNAAYRIQNRWKNAIVEPKLRLGRKKIFKKMEPETEYSDDIDEELKLYVSNGLYEIY
jgi:hypothetical protein